MPVLIVVAHPDDEVLGCGAWAAALASSMEVRTCFVAAYANARHDRPDLRDFAEDIRTAQRILGLQEPIYGSFPNLELNTVPHRHLVEFMESVIERTKSDIIFTHHPCDLNDDHRHTSLACQAAARLFQRKPNTGRLRALYYMEILSSTDWSFPGYGDGFRADTFVEIGSEFLERKIKALRAYRGVMRPYPHPRSEENVRAQAAYRGGQANLNLAEAFQTAHRALTVGEMCKGQVCTGGI
ncbi:MAG: PIG-L family deacetylase [Planctomycetota bacterium]